jgi:4-hydroxybenzoate decarboxylase subunit C
MKFKPIHSTKEFIDRLKEEKEVFIFDQEINVNEELAEVQRRVVAKKGPAILFTKPKGFNFPIATNLYGSKKRIEIAFGSRPVNLIKQIAETAQKIMPPTPKKIWEARNLAFEALKVGLKKESSPKALEQEIFPVEIMKLPAIKSWPKDGGRFVTLPLVYTESLVNGKGNLGMYRIQFHDSNTTGMHIQIHRGGGFHYFEAEQLGKNLPCHLYVGGPPSMTMASIAPMPEELSELIIASLLLGERLKVTKNPKISSLPIVSDTDFTFIGEIPIKERRAEGPFGDHYGYYALQHDYPVFKVKKLFHRKDAIWPATVVGRPPQEDHYIAEFLQELLSPMFPIVMPKVESVWAYEESGVHTLAAAVVKERYPKEAFTAALRILGEGHLSLSKCMFITNEKINLKDFGKTFLTILERTNIRTDLHIFSNISQDTLDYTGPEVSKGSKLVLLGVGEKRNDLKNSFTGKLKSKKFSKPIIFIPGVLVIQGNKYNPKDNLANELLKEESINGFQFVFLVDDSIDATKSDHDFLWNIFTRFEPAGDIYGHYEIIRNHISYNSPIVVDARLKTWYPEVLVPDPKIVKAVDEKFGKIIDQIQ